MYCVIEWLDIPVKGLVAVSIYIDSKYGNEERQFLQATLKLVIYATISYNTSSMRPNHT